MPVPDFCHSKMSSRGTKLGGGGPEELSARGGDTEQRCTGEEHKSSENLKVNMWYIWWKGDMVAFSRSIHLELLEHLSPPPAIQGGSRSVLGSLLLKFTLFFCLSCLPKVKLTPTSPGSVRLPRRCYGSYKNCSCKGEREKRNCL